MRVTQAWTTTMQSLADNPDVRTVTNAASIPGILGTIATLLRDHDGSNPEMLEYALNGAYQIIYALLDAQLESPDEEDDSESAIGNQAKAMVQSVRGLYASAANRKELDRRRGKVLELLVYRRIAELYVDGDCQMDCSVTGNNAYYHNLKGREFDVCAWDENRLMGEAYECAVRPYGLVYRDCTALITLTKAVKEDYADEDNEPWFRVGLVSFEHSRNMRARIRKLAGTEAEREEFTMIEAFGWDNLDTIAQ